MRETALNFGPSRSLVGILTRPTSVNPELPSDFAVIFVNAGIIHRVGPNRIHVRLARQLASAGVSSLRMDLPGIGDSQVAGSGPSVDVDNIAAIRTAMQLLEKHEIAHRFTLFGLCSGADLCFRTTYADRRVVGMCIVDPTGVFPTWKSKVLGQMHRLFRLAGWMRLLKGQHPAIRSLRRRIGLARRSEPPLGSLKAPSHGGPDTLAAARSMVTEALQSLVERRVRMCYLITGSLRDRYNYRAQLLDAFPIPGLQELTRIKMLRTAKHTFPREESRVALERTLEEWIVATDFADAEVPAAVASSTRSARPAGQARGEKGRPGGVPVTE